MTVIYKYLIKNFIFAISMLLIFSCDVQKKTIIKYKEVITNPLGMKFVYIKPGTFMMGPNNEYYVSAKYQNTKQHKVTLTKGFYMQTTEVTIGQWKKFIKGTGYKTDAEKKGYAFIHDDTKEKGTTWRNPGYNYTDSYPVTIISWNDSQEFINWINIKFNQNYRLPTEAKWEYACRSGSNTHFYGGNLSKEGVLNNSEESNDALDKVAWYYSNSKGHPHSVGLKQPNAWGLYDMHGNVWEFCQDHWIFIFPLEHLIDPINRTGKKMNEL